MSMAVPENPGKDTPSPDPMTVRLFHLYSDVDTDQTSQHHTIGPGNNQAAAGSHTHNGSDSPLLYEGQAITGSRGGNTALASIIALLVQQGATDQTTA